MNQSQVSTRLSTGRSPTQFEPVERFDHRDVHVLVHGQWLRTELAPGENDRAA
jgi:hypothetical protein